MNRSFKFSGPGMSRRDLLKAGALGAVGLSMPLVVPSRAHAGVFQQNYDPGPSGVTLSGFPTAPTHAGDRVCMSATNITGQDLVLVWYSFYAPGANGYPTDPAWRVQELSNLEYWVIPAGRTVPFCGHVLTDCHQDDIAIYPANWCRQIPGLIGTLPGLIDAVGIGVPGAPRLGTLIWAEIMGTDDGGECMSRCCIRMTGGGQTDGLFTLGGVPVRMSQGFQLRMDGGHSNLEVNFPDPDGSGISQFHLGPPDGFSDFHCGKFDCGTGNGGGRPLNDPNSIWGLAVGTLDGEPATVFVNFVDCGEPGVNDRREITIWRGDYRDDPVFDVVPVIHAGSLNDGRIVHGNNQAHKC